MRASWICSKSFGLVSLAIGSLSAGLVFASPTASATDATQTASQISALLDDFLAKVDQAAMHDRFWADDLIYTSALGKVSDKATILRGFDAAATTTASNAPADRYRAEDVKIRSYGDSAALTFRLIHHGSDGSTTHYRNSGMLVLREGRWQVVTWQATRVPDQAPTDK